MLRVALSLTVFCLVAVGCDGDNPVAPTPPPQSTDAVVAQSVEISGTTTFQVLGITSQLAIVAQFSDGSSQDVSDQSIWETSDPAIVTTSGTGLLTTVGFGDAEVTASFQSLTAFKPVSVTQPPPQCSLMLSVTDTFNRNGGSGSVAVQTEKGCHWTASTDVSWITIPGSRTGTGPGTINYVVDPLTNGTSRTGQITFTLFGVPDQAVLIRQENIEGPEPAFRYFVTPVSRIVGSYYASYTVTVTLSRPDAEWTATSNQPWLVITAVRAAVRSPAAHEGTSGTGEAVVTYRVEQNPLNLERIGTITVEGLSHQFAPAVHTVMQRGQS